MRFLRGSCAHIRMSRMRRRRQDRPIESLGDGRLPMKIARMLRAGIALGLATTAFSVSAQRATQADVQELADRWASAYNKHDRAALGGLYTDGARLMMHGA